MRTESLLEHEVASVGDRARGSRFSLQEIGALDHAQRVTGVGAFGWSGRDKVRAAQHVGILAASNVRLEILPKIKGLGLSDSRNTLIRMIANAWDVEVRDGEITALDSQDRDLLEILIKLFARRLSWEVRAGLSRAYCRQENDLGRLRGKMDVTRQFTRLAASPQKIACRYDELSADTALNRLLLCAVNLLRQRSVRADTQRLLSEIAAHFEDVQEVSASTALAERFALLRTDQRWQTSATLARLLLSSIYQTAHGGLQDGVALMFDMNQLFEAYVATLVRRACAPLGFVVHSQGPRRCLARSETGAGVFRTKPDIHIERDGKVVVLDTKWKRIEAGKPNFGVSQSDAYQMHGYAHVYASHAAVLLYPHHEGMAGHPGMQTEWQFETAGTRLRVATIDVANPGDFATMLLGVLELREAA